MTTIRTDALVIGGGLAGLFAALHLPDDFDVIVVDKGNDRAAGSSPLAQGGMAVAVGPQDSPEQHAADTIRAGAGACSVAAVEVLVHEAPAALEELIALGCEFDREPGGDLDLHREGGQTFARSVHSADATGRELMRGVVPHARKRAKRMLGSAVRLLTDAGRCYGAEVMTPDGPVTVIARGVLLCTGGCGALFASTTNEALSTGDGIALGYEAGAAVSDLEFVQFHPTALAAGSFQRALLTEALRGDGAVLVDAAGKAFMAGIHPDADLAPRDVVARAIAERGGAFLDLAKVGAERLELRFPNVTKAIRDAGFDPIASPVPVEPAAHYLLGGVATDVWGRTSLDGLYAAGECAATGLHGANRMAGNSLTEAVVFGRRAALALAREVPDDLHNVAEPEALQVGESDPAPLKDLRDAMWAGAGLVRTAESLSRTAKVIDDVQRVATPDVRLAAVTAGLVVRAAMLRTESRGVHYRADAPDRSPVWDGAHVRFTESGQETS